MQPTMNDWQRLDELLERGLDFYGRQLVSEAIQCWREVLYLSPGHRLALEYLEAAGASAEDDLDVPPVQSRSRTSASMTAAMPMEAAAPSSDEPPLSIESLSVLAVELIRERRLEEALALLYTAHGEAPKDQAISRSINVIKQRLTREYRTEIGDLGNIPHLTVDESLIDELDLLDEEREVLRLMDGIVALDDVVQTAGLGPLHIYRVLAQLLRRNLIVLKPPSATAPEQPAKPKRTVEDSPRTKTAPFRPVLVPPAPLEPVAAPPASGPKLVSLPPVPEPPPAKLATPAAEPAAAQVKAPAAPAASATPAASTKPAAPAAPTTPAAPAASATPAAPPPPAKVATSTALPSAPATSPTKVPNAIATSVTSVLSAGAAASASSSGIPAQSLDTAGSGAIAAILGTITDTPSRRPSAYAAHVAEAVRAHLQGHHARAKELLAMCIQECPDDPAAKRNLQRLKERLGVKEER